MFGLKNDEILTCLLLIVVGYIIAKMFSKRCEGFSNEDIKIVPKDRSTNLSIRADIDYKCECMNPQTPPATYDGGEHIDPLEDYCKQFTQNEYSCEQVYYKDLLGNYKVCNWENNKCTSDNSKTCTILDIKDSVNVDGRKVKCSNVGDTFCCQ